MTPDEAGYILAVAHPRIRRLVDEALAVAAELTCIGCDDCPVGGVDALGRVCPSADNCDVMERAALVQLDMAHGRHPWGEWKCVMQRAVEQ